tara:strand:+ start:223 stop:411 length:189 start_codon:yes stop_codon:yes gene_type:complete
MRDLFDKEFQKEMDDFFDYLDYEVLGKTKPEVEEDDELPTSDCCGAELIYNDQLCGDCKEHV